MTGLWAATTAGRVLVSHNANAADPTAVSFTQIDNLAASSPGRAISRVTVDPLAADGTASGRVMAAQGLPVVTVGGLTMNADSRQLLAATHGRGAYQLTRP